MNVLLFLALVALAGLNAYLSDRHLRDERARVNDLLRLVEAKAAPAEVAAYLAPTPPPEAPERYIWSEDGLVGVRTEPEPE